MAGNPTLNAIKTTTVGVRVVTGAASVDAALPVDSTGALGKFYRFATVSGAAHVRVGPSGATATTGDLLVTPAGVVLDCGGCTNFQHLQETAGAVLQVSPVEGG